MKLDDHILDREARLSNHLGSSARSQKPDIVLDETLRQVQQAGLIVDGDDGCDGGLA